MSKKKRNKKEKLPKSEPIWVEGHKLNQETGKLESVRYKLKPKGRCRPLKKKPDPILCKVCAHNMGRARCKVYHGKYGVRCGKCKTVYEITISFPTTHSPNETNEKHEHD